MNSPGVFADLAAQRACWHPVAFAGEVADRAVHAGLLGEPPLRGDSAEGRSSRGSGQGPYPGVPRTGTVRADLGRPGAAPVAAELHLRFDAVAVAYRKAMRNLGLAAATPIGITME